MLVEAPNDLLAMQGLARFRQHSLDSAAAIQRQPFVVTRHGRLRLLLGMGLIAVTGKGEFQPIALSLDASQLLLGRPQLPFGLGEWALSLGQELAQYVLSVHVGECSSTHTDV